jgi:hypothetical protein
MALYNDLPGFEVEVHDGNLTLPAEPSPTQTVLIIAPTSTAGVAGPYEESEYDPVALTGQSDFETKSMGTYDSSNPMARLWKQAYDAGCRDIRAIQLKGTTAAERYGFLHDIFYVLEDNIAADIVLVGGIYADDSVTDAVTFTFTRDDYAARIASATNSGTAITDEAVGTGDGIVAKFTLDNKPILASTLVVKVATTTVPTTDYTVDVLKGEITFIAGKIPASEAAVTASYTHYPYNFAAQLAGFCEIVYAKNRQVLGVIALKPPVNSNLATVKTYVEAQKSQYYSEFVQVIGGSPLWFNIGSSLYEDMWHGAYAGYVSLLPAYSSPTSKVIPGALLASYKLSPTQILSLINKHIVVPRVRNGRILVAEAVTTASDTSDFVRLTTVRIVNDVVTMVREICEPYIGEPNTVPKRSALDTAIREGLTKMVTAGALNDFRFHIKSTVADQIEGTMRINLDIVPVFETRRILMSVAVKPML